MTAIDANGELDRLMQGAFHNYLRIRANDAGFVKVGVVCPTRLVPPPALRPASRTLVPPPAPLPASRASSRFPPPVPPPALLAAFHASARPDVLVF